MSDFPALVRSLLDQKVDFIVIGGMAAAAHGSIRNTLDLDVVYSRTPENIHRVVDALSPYHPYLRGAPPGLPFIWDELTIARGLNFTLDTDLGPIDILGEVAGGGTFDALRDESKSIKFSLGECLCLNLDALIRVKRAAGRPKDFEAIAELEALWEEEQNKNE